MAAKTSGSVKFNEDAGKPLEYTRERMAVQVQKGVRGERFDLGWV